MKESDFQRRVIRRIKSNFPACMVLKNDPNYIQGIPDLLILFRDRWAALECKQSSEASIRPNQQHYVAKMDGMSFARFICPENEEEIFRELRQTFRVEG